MPPTVEIRDVTPSLKHIALRPPVPGYQNFIGAYLFRGQRTAIVDPGPASAIPNLLLALDELAISPLEIDYLILTHIHQDHAGGTGTALRAMTNAMVVAHGRGRRHLIDPTRLWEGSRQTLGELAHQYGRIEPVPEDRIIVTEDLMDIDLGGVTLRVHHTPGHAAHHLSLFEEANRVIIAGDAAGAWTNGVVRPTTPPPFRLEDSLASLDRLKELRPRILCYSHLGCTDPAIDMLDTCRRRMIDWHEIINSAAREGNDPETILALLRERDHSLDYLADLDEDEYRRDHFLMLNTIRGMSGSG